MMPEKRKEEFQRNSMLEDMLQDLNRNLWDSEKKLLKKKESKYPLIIILGPHRSGSTLLMQWLANTKLFAYPTNLLSRFYHAPIIGAKIQLLLTDERYNFRNELRDFAKNEIELLSENGKTKGVLAPNEFWYFWRRFLPFKELDFIPTEELLKKVDVSTLKAEFAGVAEVFQKPFALKGMILNYNIDFLHQIFDKVLFIYTKRDPKTNIESALKARERQFGDRKKWYSFKIPEYSFLKDIEDPVEQTTRQIYYINKAVNDGLSTVEDEKKLILPYEEFCSNPEKFYELICKKLANQGYNITENYKLQEKFIVTRKNVSEEVKTAYEKYYRALS